MGEESSFLCEVSEKSIGVWSYFMKKFKNDFKEESDVIKNLKLAQEELDLAINNYEYAADPDLVDYYTYNIKAAQKKYEYLLKKVKEQGNNMN